MSLNLSLHLNFLNYVNAVMDLLMMRSERTASTMLPPASHSATAAAVEIITAARVYYLNDFVLAANCRVPDFSCRIP